VTAPNPRRPRQARDRDRSRDRGRARLLARTRKEWMAVGYELLDDPDRYLPPSEPGRASVPDADDAAAEIESAGDADGDPAPGLAPRQLIGARPPVVLLRLEAVPDGVSARLLVSPRPEAPAEREVLDELRAFVEARFRDGKASLSPGAWDRLVGGEPADPLRRAALLTRLAANGGTPFAAGRADNPNDRGLEQFRGKFAALPDGLPFSLRLLIRDDRGNKKGKKGASEPECPPGVVRFSGLPWFIRLQTLCGALRDEEREILAAEDFDSKMLTDERFAKRLYDAANGAMQGDVRVVEPAVADLTELRRTLKVLGGRPGADGLRDLFPNAAGRAARYRAQRARPAGRRPATA
jgi:hypothetical protein